MTLHDNRSKVEKDVGSVEGFLRQCKPTVHVYFRKPVGKMPMTLKLEGTGVENAGVEVSQAIEVAVNMLWEPDVRHPSPYGADLDQPLILQLMDEMKASPNQRGK